MELREIKQTDGWKVELVDGERSVSRLWIFDRHMRIGAATVYVGGIGGVGTDRDYRNQGLARRVLEASVELMVREGYDASFLFGIRDFYHRFGFVTCMAEQQLKLDTRVAEKANRKLKLRSARKSDFSAIARLYNRDNRYRTGTIVRNPRRFNSFPMGSDFDVPVETKVIVDKADRLLGYVAYDKVDNRCRAAEVTGRGEEVFSTALNLLAQRAVTLRREHISLSMAADHPFALYCRNYGVQLETQYRDNSGAMGRVINLATFIAALKPELERRWQTVKNKPLALRTDIGSCSLSMDRDSLKVDPSNLPKDGARLDQAALMQLAMGYQTASSLAACRRLKATQTATEQLDWLFPIQQAHMSWPDRF
jgi:predicted acetyltransferase